MPVKIFIRGSPYGFWRWRKRAPPRRHATVTVSALSWGACPTKSARGHAAPLLTSASHESPSVPRQRRRPRCPRLVEYGCARGPFGNGLAGRSQCLSVAIRPRRACPETVAISGAWSRPTSTASPIRTPLLALFIADRATRREPTVNLLLSTACAPRSCMPAAAIWPVPVPSQIRITRHLSFVDMCGHGCAVLTADARQFSTEFVCIERPVEARGPDRGPLRYRVVHRAAAWSAGETSRLRQQVLEGKVDLTAMASTCARNRRSPAAAARSRARRRPARLRAGT